MVNSNGELKILYSQNILEAGTKPRKDSLESPVQVGDSHTHHLPTNCFWFKRSEHGTVSPLYA